MKFSLDKTEQYSLMELLEEKIDASRSSQLKSELITLHAEGITNLLLDMRQVKYIDSSALSALLTANRMCNQGGGILVIFGLNDSPKKLIEISQLDRIFTILPTLQEAIDRVFLHVIEKGLEEEG